jgi:hypothetical protein
MKTKKIQKTYSFQEAKEVVDGYIDQSALRLQKRLKTGLKKI